MTDVVLHAYRLAKFYGVDPDVFLAKPASSILRHIKRTNELIQQTEEEARLSEDS